MATVGADAKRLKLDTTYLVGLRRTPYSNIRSVLEALPAQLREACKVNSVDSDLKKAANDIFDDDLRTSIELPLEDGTTFTWILARPQATLRKFAANSPALKRILAPSQSATRVTSRCPSFITMMGSPRGTCFLQYTVAHLLRFGLASWSLGSSDQHSSF